LYAHAESVPMAERRHVATVKVDAALLRKAKQTCTLENIKLQDYFDRLVRGPIERDNAKALRKLRESAGEEQE
jgi:hypothetical protein